MAEWCCRGRRAVLAMNAKAWSMIYSLGVPPIRRHEDADAIFRLKTAQHYVLTAGQHL